MNHGRDALPRCLSYREIPALDERSTVGDGYHGDGCRAQGAFSAGGKGYVSKRLDKYAPLIYNQERSPAGVESHQALK